jgi:putative exporter of polyketide antibiotics
LTGQHRCNATRQFRRNVTPTDKELADLVAEIQPSSADLPLLGNGYIHRIQIGKRFELQCIIIIIIIIIIIVIIIILHERNREITLQTQF